MGLVGYLFGLAHLISNKSGEYGYICLEIWTGLCSKNLDNLVTFSRILQTSVKMNFITCDSCHTEIP